MGGPVLSDDSDYSLLGMITEVDGIKTRCIQTSVLLNVLSNREIPFNLLTNSINQSAEIHESQFVDFWNPWVGDMIAIRGGEFKMGSDKRE